VEDPGVHGRDESVTVDEVHLQRQDAEEEVAVGHGAGWRGVGHGLVLVWGQSGATALWFEGKGGARRLLYLAWGRWARKKVLVSCSLLNYSAQVALARPGWSTAR